jgi:transcriptional regulator GlxA family with amidase domain
VTIAFPMMVALSIPAAAPRTRSVAVVLYEGVELLDFAGPGEVFAAAAHAGASRGTPAFRVYTVSRSKAPITSQHFVKVLPEFSIEDAPKPDLIVIPGGGAESLMDDIKFMAWTKKAAAEAEVAMTVCTGAVVLGRAGLLDGHNATTWYRGIDHLRKVAPKANVSEGRRFIDEGQIVTTAGVSAGIDGALHVVARLLGRAVADRTARYMEYHWSPEAYLAQSYSFLNPSLNDAGRAVQLACIHVSGGQLDDALAVLKTAGRAGLDVAAALRDEECLAPLRSTAARLND